MRRFDVYRNPNLKSRKTVPYLVVLQSELLDGLATQMVGPLMKVSALGTPARRLNPVFQVEGEAVCLLTQQIGAVARASLNLPIANLAEHRPAITAALDLLFTGI